MREGTLQELIGATAKAFSPFDPEEAPPIDPEGPISFLQRMVDMASPTESDKAYLRELETTSLSDLAKDMRTLTQNMNTLTTITYKVILPALKRRGLGVGPSQVIDLVCHLRKKGAVLRLRMAILGLKLPF